jgi:hypothetical protein
MDLNFESLNEINLIKINTFIFLLFLKGYLIREIENIFRVTKSACHIIKGYCPSVKSVLKYQTEYGPSGEEARSMQEKTEV